MMIAGAVLLCSWVLVLDKVYAAGGDGIVPTLISLAYPVGDVVLITMELYVLLPPLFELAKNAEVLRDLEQIDR